MLQQPSPLSRFLHLLLLQVLHDEDNYDNDDDDNDDNDDDNDNDNDYDPLALAVKKRPPSFLANSPQLPPEVLYHPHLYHHYQYYYMIAIVNISSHHISLISP